MKKGFVLGKYVKISGLMGNLIQCEKMTKKIKCKIINSVSLNADKRSAAVEEACADVGREMVCYAYYSAVLGKSKSEHKVDRGEFNILA